MNQVLSSPYKEGNKSFNSSPPSKPLTTVTTTFHRIHDVPLLYVLLKTTNTLTVMPLTQVRAIQMIICEEKGMECAVLESVKQKLILYSLLSVQDLLNKVILRTSRMKKWIPLSSWRL